VLIDGDVGDEQHCRELVRRTMEAFGRLDVLVNNAALQRTHEKLADFTAEEIERTFRTNIESMFFLAKAAQPHMKPGGSIINTTSIQADDPSPQLLAYATTKGAIANFTAGLAQFVARDGIRVNAVAPGPVWTPLIPSTMPAEKAANFGANTPLGRPAQPAELAPAYVFLASNEARYITGAVLPVTGGRPML
jgi:NAD(P)-dependent dehydrogenase (short-subunit alcohol dehydrogenase family)